MGSWVTYGLGTENNNLPGFITICPTLSHGGANNYSSAFLPAIYQATPMGSAGTPTLPDWLTNGCGSPVSGWTAVIYVTFARNRLESAGSDEITNDPETDEEETKIAPFFFRVANLRPVIPEEEESEQRNELAVLLVVLRKEA